MIKPWGWEEVVYSAPWIKVKILNVAAGQRLSLQKHKKRREVWTVVAGVAWVEHGMNPQDMNEAHLYPGDTTSIKKEEWHRLNNTSWGEPLIVVETSYALGAPPPVGPCLIQDLDITRIEDDYGREIG